MFGCGEALASGNLLSLSERAYGLSADRLRHWDGLDRDALDWARELRLRAGVWLASAFGGGGGGTARPPSATGRVHHVPSTPETVRLGVFDSTLPNIIEVDSGDVVVYPDTWSHFLNRLQPGTSIDELAQLRRENVGRGPHSIIGPVSVRGAAPGDLIEVQFQRLNPVGWGATFVNPGDLGTGTLPGEFATGQVRYLQLDPTRRTAEFLPGINVPVAPFQGTFASAPAVVGVVSSVPPGQHAGNIDLRDLTEGTSLFIPVWQPGGKLYTGDSHAAQGDGEVNNQALESAMAEVRVRLVLHKQAGWHWPFAETADHWIALGIDGDLNEAFRIATRNTIAFLHRRAGLSELDAYSLTSIAVSLRVTQFVNQTRGVHALIPKALFTPERRPSITLVDAP